MKRIFSILTVLFCLSASAQQYIDRQQSNNNARQPQRSGMLFSNTAYDQFAFSLTPSSVFYRAFQFDVAYRFDNSRHALMLTVANINSNFFGENSIWNEDDAHFGWSFNLLDKIFLPSVVKSNTAYYFMHGLHINHIDGTQYTGSVSVENPDGSITLEDGYDSYTFNRIGYNLIVGFETMLNERFFFDINIGIGARWLMTKPGIEISDGSLNRSLTGAAYTGLTPMIGTRFGMYIF